MLEKLKNRKLFLLSLLMLFCLSVLHVLDGILTIKAIALDFQEANIFILCFWRIFGSFGIFLFKGILLLLIYLIYGLTWNKYGLGYRRFFCLGIFLANLAVLLAVINNLMVIGGM